MRAYTIIKHPAAEEFSHWRGWCRLEVPLIVVVIFFQQEVITFTANNAFSFGDAIDAILSNDKRRVLSLGGF